jgi:hypothetical protein
MWLSLRIGDVKLEEGSVLLEMLFYIAFVPTPHSYF